MSKWILLEFSARAAAEAVAVGTRPAGTAVVLDGVVRFGFGGVGVGVHHQRHFGKRRQGAEQAQQQGYTQGYSEGNQKAVQETQAKMAELSEKEAAMEREYQEKLDNVEPYLVDKLTDIYDHIFAVDLSEYRNVIFHLISNTLHALENTDTYLIHVSEQDYQFVSMQKTQIAEDGGVKPSMLEFVEDRTLGKNECLIETPDGIYDCSLSVQLSELKRKLLLLSYSGAKEQ